jgi:bifunctional enzyme CysN/CysC
MNTNSKVDNAPEEPLLTASPAREQMNIVVVGHVDHGKSTVIGRLLADTHSLPEGKLEQVKAACRKGARPFEYAFLLDALKDEQAQGITIDTARCFFKTAKRDYIIIDAPGHVEFLKNMVSGAARAEAALLVIDAHEGIQENSRRHGYMLAMLGIRQVVVLVNKMDLVKNDLAVFARIRDEYSAFLKEVGITPIDYVPICARDGDNIAQRATWSPGVRTVLEHIDAFVKEREREKQPFRFPVQDVYKFTANHDDRRIFAGTIETGSIYAGDEIVFLPSQKRSKIASIERFNAPRREQAHAGEAIGFTLTDELYVRPGEIMCKTGDKLANTSSRFRANVFWMGKAPLVKNKKYKLKLATLRAPVRLVEIINVLDASDLSSERGKHEVERHEVADCIFEATKPIVFDLSVDIEGTGRFVLVDNYEIAGGGIITENASASSSSLQEHIRQREAGWEHSAIPDAIRAGRYGHRSKFVVVTGASEAANKAIAQALEKRLFDESYIAYYLGIANIDRGLDSDVLDPFDERDERVRRLGEVARILTDSGQIFITTITDVDAHDIERLKALNAPNEILVVVVGKADYQDVHAHIQIPDGEELPSAIKRVCLYLREQEIITDYCI